MLILDDFKKEPKVEYYKYKSPVAKKDALPEDQRKRLTHLVGLCMNKYITVTDFYIHLSIYTFLTFKIVKFSSNILNEG